MSKGKRLLASSALVLSAGGIVVAASGAYGGPTSTSRGPAIENIDDSHAVLAVSALANGVSGRSAARARPNVVIDIY